MDGRPKRPRPFRFAAPARPPHNAAMTAEPRRPDPSPPPSPSDEAQRGADPAAARRFFRSFVRGTLTVDGRPFDFRFVVDGRDFTVVGEASAEMIEGEEWVLHLPSEGEDGVQALLRLREFDAEADGTADRYVAYHGKPRRPHWVRGEIDGVKYAGDVLDAPEFVRPNTLRPVEGRLIRLANADRERLTRLAERLLGVSPQEPVCVGVDQDGMDVRGAYGIIRLEFTPPIDAPEDAEARLAALLEGREAGGAEA